MTDEKRPLRKSMLDSYLSTSTSDSTETETVMGYGSEGQRMTIFGWFAQKCKRNWPFKYLIAERKKVKFHSRIVDRDGDFCQSNGKMAIKKKIRGEDWRALYAGDLFHSLIDAPSYRSIGILLTGYMLLVVLFSIPYYHISKTYGCDMGIDSYQESFAFSLETMATIGYGTQDIFFNNCWSPILVLACQISCKLIADAVIIGVIYSRFGRPNTRASTIIFSNHAVIRRISGKLYFMFQLVELRKHQLIEAQVRLYVIKKDVDPPPESTTQYETEEEDVNGNEENLTISRDETAESLNSSSNETGKRSVERNHPLNNTNKQETKEVMMTNFQTCKMRLNYPNDELGGMLIMCLPQVVVHEIDVWSPLMPPPLWRSCRNTNKVFKWSPQVYDDLQFNCGVNHHHNHHNDSCDKSNNYNQDIKFNNKIHKNFTTTPSNSTHNNTHNNHVNIESGSNIINNEIASNRSSHSIQTPRPVPLKRHKSKLLHAVKFPNIMLRTKTLFARDDSKEVNSDNSELKEHSWETKGIGRESLGIISNQPGTLSDASENQEYEGFHENLQNAESLRKPLLNKSREKTNNLNSSDDEHSPKENSYINVPPMMTVKLNKNEEEKIMVSHYMNDRKMEIMAIIEGIDASTGGVVQARHSYVFNEIEWDRSFKPCVFEDKKDGSAIIDFSVFHELVGVSEDADHPGSMSSHT